MEKQMESITILGAITDVIIVVDKSKNVVWSNQPTFTKVPDNSRLPCVDVFGGCSGTCPADAVIAGAKSSDGTITDSEGRMWSVKAFPIEKSKERLCVLIYTDVTEKVAQREKNLRAEQLAALGELAAIVAHEINNPLAGLISCAQLLESQKDTPNFKVLVETISSEANRISCIVKDMLCYARAGEEKGYHDAEDLFSGVVNLAKSQLEKDGIKLDKIISSESPRAFCNKRQIQQVILNLIQNARDALNTRYGTGSHKDKTLILKVDKVGGFLELSVTDFGCGIPQPNIKKLTTPFFTTKPAGVGTGLGLPISQTIANEHKGCLRVESVEGEFTTVTLSIPAGEVPDEQQ